MIEISDMTPIVIHMFLGGPIVTLIGLPFGATEVENVFPQN